MNNQAFGILEFDPLRAFLRRDAQTDTGRARFDTLAPIDDLDELRRALRLVAEYIELRQRGGRLSFDGVADSSDSISRLRIEGTALDPLAILDLARLCERVMEARVGILAEREACPTLFEIVAALTPELNKLAARLNKKILPSGALDDRASAQLAGIRHEIAKARSRITRSLENLMRRSSEAIQEELVTIRNDRFVIPVRADHQGRIKGVAHGSSSSGATVFVEPLETIEANNELQTLREAEQREIAEILFALSEELRRELPAIEQAAGAITELDFISAKAAFAEKFDCVVPEVAGSADVPSALSAEGANKSPRPGSVSSENTLELIEARHPLLEESLRSSGNPVVPVSLKLDSDDSVMVISGANAGGKTVVLKTAGLLSLMALSGLPVPAKRACVPFYRSVLADIGDHQSLAANLSTFTSHVANIGKMIDLCQAAGSADFLSAPGSVLVLLDEVGTGTDPEEGSALGVAVVDHFKRRAAHVLATTHYSGLKMYAANEPGVLNASVEFDEKTLRPTYRLLVGLAGSSSGLEIAQRFGIPAEVIGNANEQVKKSSRDSVEYLRRIKCEAEEAETLRKALEEERAAVAEKFAALEEQAAKHEALRQAEFERELSRAVKEFEERGRELAAKIEDRASRLKVDREAARRAAELKREAQRVAQALSKTDRSSRGSSSQGSAPQLRGVRVIRDGQVVSDLPAEPDKTKPVQERVARAARQDIRGPQRDLKVGDRVRLLSFGSVGIVNHIKDDEAEVRVGSLRMREKLDNLELVFEVSTSGGGASERRDDRDARRNEVSTVRASGRVKPSLEDERRRVAATELHLHSGGSGSKLKTSAELNLIGKTTDEAVELTDKFLDEAFLNGSSEVRIIHGHGTGALRRAVTELLKGHPHVARFAAAPQDKGGAGATVIELNS
jgi:DNA mismatch repair protein MutS2